MVKKLAPIALFVYNRLEHTKKTIEALQNNEFADKSELYIFSDGPKNKKDERKIREVRNYIKTIKGFKKIKIIERKKNFGLADSIISGVTFIVNKHGKIIVLEDDLVTSKHFLKYMNDALELYKNEEKVGAISGYFYPVKKKLPETFFLKYYSCWGWATWKDKWGIAEWNSKKLLSELRKRKLNRLFDINKTYPFKRMLRNNIKGINNSWAIRFYASLLTNDKLVLYPKKSLVENIGFDNTGTHGQKRKIFETMINLEPIKAKKISVKQNHLAYKELQKYFKSIFWERLFSKIKRLIKHPLKEIRNL
ncbi:glycosyltransferase [Candidatus Pacearchaeota archaeon]|nr:glycosyltransferase [Candidatus Pacearchaeota archaeon]